MMSSPSETLVPVESAALLWYSVRSVYSPGYYENLKSDAETLRGVYPEMVEGLRVMNRALYMRHGIGAQPGTGNSGDLASKEDP